MRGTVSRNLLFKDVFVPDDARLMPEGLYFQAAQRWPHMFATLSPTYMGIAQAAYDFTVQYLRGEVPGMPPVKRRMYPTKQIAVAEMRIKLEQTRALFLQNARDARVDPDKDTRMRLYAAHYTIMENANDICRLAVRTCGGQSMLKSLPLERLYRDSRCGSLMLPWTAELCLDRLGRECLYEAGERDEVDRMSRPLYRSLRSTAWSGTPDAPALQAGERTAAHRESSHGASHAAGPIDARPGRRRARRLAGPEHARRMLATLLACAAPGRGVRAAELAAGGGRAGGDRQPCRRCSDAAAARPSWRRWPARLLAQPRGLPAPASGAAGRRATCCWSTPRAPPASPRARMHTAGRHAGQRRLAAIAAQGLDAHDARAGGAAAVPCRRPVHPDAAGAGGRGRRCGCTPRFDAGGLARRRGGAGARRTSLLVPAMMQRAARRTRAGPAADLSSLRFVNSGSQIVPVPLIDAFHARGVPVAQVYGATETGPVSIVLRPDEALAHVGSVGRPAPGVLVAVQRGAPVATARSARSCCRRRT